MDRVEYLVENVAPGLPGAIPVVSAPVGAKRFEVPERYLEIVHAESLQKHPRGLEPFAHLVVFEARVPGRPVLLQLIVKEICQGGGGLDIIDLRIPA